MEFLVNVKKQSRRAHLWNENSGDTYCRMYSTGGLKCVDKYLLLDHDSDREICSICEEQFAKIYRHKK